MARCLFDAGQLQEALEEGRQALVMRQQAKSSTYGCQALLGKVLAASGRLEEAEAEYQAALTVQGGPEQARQAAQKGLADTARDKSVERP